MVSLHEMQEITEQAKLRLACITANQLIDQAVKCQILDEDEGNAYFDVLVDGLMTRDTDYITMLFEKGLDGIYGTATK